MAQFSPQGLEILKGYDRALRQRNAALRATPLSFAEIAAWEAQMAIHAVPLLHLQRGVLVELQPAVATHLDGLAAGEPLTMQLESGWSSKSAVASAIAEGQLPSDTELQGLMRDRWAERRGADIERGHTQEGPHRADLALQLQGRDARLYGSQGQTRSIALALRFAESTLTEKAAGEPPILLLDDILGELDRHRAAYFVRMLSRVGHQAILTATDAAPIQAELPIARRFKVSRGIILSE
jgi:DNA replication and repair protein RecF